MADVSAHLITGTGPFDVTGYYQDLVAICTTYRVRRLEVFGSVARSDFDHVQSDIDVLVNFIDERSFGAFERYFGLKEALEKIFQRSVDLVEEQAIKNPYFLQAINKDRKWVYGTTN